MPFPGQHPRGGIKADPARARQVGFCPGVEIGEVMTGGAVSRVERSLNPKFQEGDLVVGASGWQSHRALV